MLLVNYALTLFLIAAPIVYLFILCYLLRKEIRESIPQILMLILLSVVFLNKLLFSGQTLAQKDFNNIQVPMFQFFHDSIRSYFLPPIWNNSFGGGFDAFSSPLSAFFSVFNWVFLIGNDVYKSFSIFIFVQVVLCAVFSYLMLKEFQFQALSSLLGSVLFTFNGFVVMRLSEGVGIEYLYAYKWLPLMLLFSRKFLYERRRVYTAGLAISLAFAFEGNINQVMGIAVMLLIFLLTEYKKSLAVFKLLVVSGLLCFFIYAVKLVPFIGLAADGIERFSGKTGGWRQGNLDWDMFPQVFIPMHFNYSNAIFTPGVIGLSVALLGFFTALALLVAQKKVPFNGFMFSIASLCFAFLITIENPFYRFFYSLPGLRAVTQIPTFLIFYIMPIVFLGAFFIKSVIKCNVVCRLFLLFLPFAVFLEVLLGPSTFGKNTYSFNFPKMDIEEAGNFPHYNLLAKQPPGIFSFADAEHAKIFFYPYGIVRANLKTLEGYKYYFGSLTGDTLLSSGLSEIARRSDYIFTRSPVEDRNFDFLGRVSMSKITNFKSYAVYANLYEYLDLYESGWNDDVYLYKTKCTSDCPIKNYSDGPVGFSIKLSENYIGKSIPSSIAYSKWLKVKYGDGYSDVSADPLGYVEINNVVGAGQTLEFFFVNPYIYAGLALSFFGLVVAIRIARESYLEKHI